jgi:hypothetical protein
MGKIVMMNTVSETEFAELERLIKGGLDYGPSGFKETGDKARRTSLLTGLDNLAVSKPGYLKFTAYVISDRTVLFPLDTFFPECQILTVDTQIPRMVCLADPHKCHVNKNCLNTLLTRLGAIAQKAEEWKLFILYWLHEGSIMGLVVRAEDSKQRFIQLNKYSLDYFVRHNSTKYEIEFGSSMG